MPVPVSGLFCLHHVPHPLHSEARVSHVPSCPAAQIDSELVPPLLEAAERRERETRLAEQLRAALGAHYFDGCSRWAQQPGPPPCPCRDGPESWKGTKIVKAHKVEDTYLAPSILHSLTYTSDTRRFKPGVLLPISSAAEAQAQALKAAQTHLAHRCHRCRPAARRPHRPRRTRKEVDYSTAAYDKILGDAIRTSNQPKARDKGRAGSAEPTQGSGSEAEEEGYAGEEPQAQQRRPQRGGSSGRDDGREVRGKRAGSLGATSAKEEEQGEQGDGGGRGVKRQRREEEQQEGPEPMDVEGRESPSGDVGARRGGAGAAGCEQGSGPQGGGEEDDGGSDGSPGANGVRTAQREQQQQQLGGQAERQAGDEQEG